MYVHVGALDHCITCTRTCVAGLWGHHQVYRPGICLWWIGHSSRTALQYYQHWGPQSFTAARGCCKYCVWVCGWCIYMHTYVQLYVSLTCTCSCHIVHVHVSMVSLSVCTLYMYEMLHMYTSVYLQVEFQVGVSHHSKMLRAVNIRPKFAFIRGNIDSIKEQVRRLDKGLPGCALIGCMTQL